MYTKEAIIIKMGCFTINNYFDLIVYPFFTDTDKHKIIAYFS